MWTATITEKNRGTESIDIIVRLDNGQISFTKIYTASLVGNNEGWLKGQIRSTIANLEALDVIETTIVIGPVDITIPKDTGTNPTDQ